MRIDLEFVELHTSLFLSGVNFGLKLYPNSKGGIEMYYDTDIEHTVIVYKDKVAIIESTASKTLKDPRQININTSHKITKETTSYQLDGATGLPVIKRAQISGPEPYSQTQAIQPMQRISAQIETPITNMPRKPGRPAKYQGEEKPE